MNHPNEPTTPRPSGSAFRRGGATVAVACILAGSIIVLGTGGALAISSNPPAASTPAASSVPAAQAEPKVVYSEADLAAFAASPYVDDALNLAVVWGMDPETTKGKAGAKLQAGTALPFAPGEATTTTYTSEQQRSAFFLTNSNFSQALGLAVAWESGDVFSAKAKIGDLLLTRQTVPIAPTTFTDEQDAAAFTLAGYTDADAARLAALWQSHSAHSAQVRAGAELLAGETLQL